MFFLLVYLSLFKPDIYDKADGANSPEEVLVWAGCEENSTWWACFFLLQDCEAPGLARVHSNRQEFTQIRVEAVPLVLQNVSG